MKISLENMNMEIKPFLGILDDIGARYNAYIRWDKQIIYNFK